MRPQFKSVGTWPRHINPPEAVRVIGGIVNPALPPGNAAFRRMPIARREQRRILALGANRNRDDLGKTVLHRFPESIIVPAQRRHNLGEFRGNIEFLRPIAFDIVKFRAID